MWGGYSPPAPQPPMFRRAWSLSVGSLFTNTPTCWQYIELEIAFNTLYFASHRALFKFPVHQRVGVFVSKALTSSN